LFQFLRRPDSIQISSARGSESEFGLPNDRILQSVKTKVRQATGAVPADAAWPTKDLKDDIPPWEKLHINNVGGLWIPMELTETSEPGTANSTPTHDQPDPLRKDTGSGSTLVERSSWTSTDPPQADKPKMSFDDIDGALNRSSEVDVILDYIPEGQAVNSRRGSALPHSSGISWTTGTEIPGTMRSTNSNSTPTSVFNLPYTGFSRRVSIDRDAILQDERKTKTMSLPSDPIRKSSESGEDTSQSASLDDDQENEQTLQEFFAQHHTPIDELEARAKQNEMDDLGPQDSAASYFNRQASLLMLYFPLAYLIVFAVSLVRLVYDMITNAPNVVLTIISLWFVLSVGLVDAAIYVSLMVTCHIDTPSG
jgi:hypothetical protein